MAVAIACNSHFLYEFQNRETESCCAALRFEKEKMGMNDRNFSFHEGRVLRE